MKKILTILLVAVLAASTLFAVDFSGKFRAGYTFGFKDGKYSAAEWKKDGDLKLTVKISDEEGLWTVNVKTLGKQDSNDALKANLSLNLAKLFAIEDITLGLNIGANEKMTALSAYNDVTGDELYKLKNDGNYSAGLDIGYGKAIQTKIQADPKTAGKGSVLVSAKTEPVDGISAAVAYGYNAYLYTTSSEGAVKHGISVSADVNVEKLADLDFKLGLSVYDNIGINEGMTINTMSAALYGGVDVVDGFFEFRMDNYMVEGADAKTYCGMKSQVNINVVEGLGLDVYFNIGNFDAIDTTYAVGGDVSYKISGVEFATNLDYAAVDGFSITPKVIIEF